MSVPIENLLRELTPQVLQTVVRRYRDFAAAEDAVQEALFAAAMQWPREGTPANPRACLTQVAFRRMVDHVRSEFARRRRETGLDIEVANTSESAHMEAARDEDDTLALFLMCCHPSLTPASAIALTLRAVGGLTTTQIARAFLVPETTMAQRISRAKQSIRSSGISFQMPAAEDRAQRLSAVLHADHHRLDAVRAHLLERAGDLTLAVAHFREAAGKTGSLPERDYLLAQAARLSSGVAPPASVHSCP
jgi:RNA polymerase sigma factor (sigma-70 family)